MTDFNNVFPVLSQALTQRGYTTLTPVQEAVLAPELGNQDLLVSAQTGSGKTVAFGLALASTLFGEAEFLGKTRVPLALIIAPTRELALQVKRELEWLFEMSGASVASCVGGMDIRSERRALKNGPHIVVGTPGRLRDHVEKGYLNTSELKAVVLDEADEMLDMGFRDELEYILEATPKARRTLLFSATVPRAILALAKRYQNNAIRVITKGEEKQHLDIEYQMISVAPSDRENAIINLLRYHEAQNTIIFCGTRAAVTLFTSRLTSRGFSVVALSGELSQNERSHALQALRDGRAQVCVATDVAARGIDLPGLELVIHADIPKNPDLLLHRSGRTGRAGSKGISALVVPHNMRRKTERLLQSAGIEASWSNPPSAEDIFRRDRERFLAHPALCEPIQENEQASVEELLARYEPKQIAAALMRLHHQQKPAPESLINTPASVRPKKQQENFQNGTWISLSVGRNGSAEPRWILSMLCEIGHLAKRQIGSIRIQQTRTYVELSPECVDGFFAAIGPEGKLERNIKASRFKGVPEELRERRQHSADSSRTGGSRDRDWKRKTETPYHSKFSRDNLKRITGHNNAYSDGIKGDGLARPKRRRPEPVS